MESHHCLDCAHAAPSTLELLWSLLIRGSLLYIYLSHVAPLKKLQSLLRSDDTSLNIENPAQVDEECGFHETYKRERM